MTDQELAGSVKAFAKFVDIEDAKLVIEVLNENAGLLASIADNAEKQGVTDVAKHVRRLVDIDLKLVDLLNGGLDSMQKRVCSDAGKEVAE